MLRRLIGEDIELSTSLASDLPTVRADPIQIEQVIVNLVVNARDAMPGGGRLSIETTVRRVPEGRAQSGGPTAGDYVVLVVSDTGSGMDAATQERIFEPFFTTKEKGKGTGLGLSTAYGIVKQSGGDIRATSVPDSGSTFEILLPAVGERADEDAAKAPVGRVAAPRHATVLLAEDEDGLRALNGRVLEAHGYRVLVASNAAEALLLAERQPGPPDSARDGRRHAGSIGTRARAPPARSASRSQGAVRVGLRGGLARRRRRAASCRSPSLRKGSANGWPSS